MKTNTLSFILIVAAVFSMNAFAMEREGPRFDRNPNVNITPEIVKWIGIVRDDPSSHTTNHEHELSFIKSDDYKVYDVIDSPALTKLHHETEKNFLVEIEAEKTPRFLFWGGNLIVKNYRIIDDLEGPVPHRVPAMKTTKDNIGDKRI